MTGWPQLEEVSEVLTALEDQQLTRINRALANHQRYKRQYARRAGEARALPYHKRPHPEHHVRSERPRYVVTDMLGRKNYAPKGP